MSAYTVLANRYRPRAFDDVVGQEDVARVLRSAIATSRAGHAFLFSGPRGVGKTSMARILAKAFNCLESSGGTPCDDCRVCRAIDGAGECLDVVEIDGASHNRVENVRELIENLRFRPVEARHRIYIIDEVHMLSTAAFNALLKTLEEPPEHAKFILATTEPLKVPETIRSRCQLFDFRRLTSAQIAGRLSTVCGAEGVEVPAELPLRLARHAQGGMRDALSLLDQLITFSDGAPTIENLQRLTGRMSPELLHGLLADALTGDTAGVYRQMSQALELGARAADLVGQLTEVLEGLLVTVAGGEVADATDDERRALAELAEGAPLDQVLAMLDVLVEASRRLRQRHDGRLVVEMAVLTMARLASLQSVADLLAGAPGAQLSRPGAGSQSAASAAGAQPPRSGAVGRQQGAPSRTREGAGGAAPVSRPDAGRQAPQARQAGTDAARQAPRVQRAATADPPTVAAQPASGAAAQAQPEAAPSTFRERFLEAIPSRSLRSELGRYGEICVEGDELLLVLPAGGPSSLFDPTSRDVSQQLLAAARKVSGRALTLHCQAGSAELATPEKGGKAAAPTPAAPGPEPAQGPSATPTEAPTGAAQAPSPADRSAAEQRIEELWPDSERVDF